MPNMTGSCRGSDLDKAGSLVSLVPLSFIDYLQYQGGPSHPSLSVYYRCPCEAGAMFKHQEGPQGDCSMHLPVPVTMGEVPHVCLPRPMLEI